MSQISLEHIDFSYGKTPALRDLDLVIEEGELHSLLGPSGCGKSTALRIIAGFLRPDSGRLLRDGTDITSLAPEQRHMGIVFQNYALFPHMNVEQNVGYGLKMAGVPKKERAGKVESLLELVGLSDFARRNAMELSGGQQQRVAIARALAPEPDVLLLDEPMANLDIALRVTLRAEILRIQKTIGVTTLLITHDQQEALSLSDRVSVMNEGHIEQTGTPHEVYEHPATDFVAGFIGEMDEVKGARYRPEQLRLAPASDSVAAIATGIVESVRYEGYATRYEVSMGDAPAAEAPHAGNAPIAVLMLNNAQNPGFAVGDKVDVLPVGPA